MPSTLSESTQLGPLLARLRRAQGWSQTRLATALCAASGVPTLSRHEVSRWERQRRVPGGFWLGWLAVVLSVPVEVLVRAAARTRGPGASPDGRVRTRPGGTRRPPAGPARRAPGGYATGGGPASVGG
ncbi:helix-turn-helix transcriptional regulator [Micromonospora sp. WMMA1363]|uniref:helix-turn-helix domain-containing protein n=1 Tax=Micromonospora sp. WMMA1363 TaxID=3053985 RepID=UPI00259C8A17|nr:helix-turn-helix transcriptional regulator [Micromonospora sp. WMMA1363]MDM4720009.1 helix-turn-helix transcriptional regulator [Micromonospora sp. WMMA1363]